MSVNVVTAIDREISNLEAKLGALKTARRVLGTNPTNGSAPAKRRKLTATEKAAISRRMKATWKKRRASAKSN